MRFIQVLVFVVVRHVLAYIQPLTYELQQVKLDISAVYGALDTTLATLKKIRDTIDTYHKEWYDQATSICNKHDITIRKPRIVNIQRYRENYVKTNISWG